MQRRLAAIFAADVVGYSRLMERDEAGTLRALTAFREDLIVPEIDEHRGRVVKYMGDGILAEFASVLDAVQAAVIIQETLADLNADKTADERFEFRIGVDLGDVVVEDKDVYGSGVNVAARLESLCDPGGVCVSQSVYHQVRGKLAAAFEDLGALKVKNIAEPVRAYRVSFGAADGASGDDSADEALPLPGKPSIAVLPFTNMSGDPSQEYFADGIAEDVTTALARFRWFFVIARNSAFSYKGRALDVKQIGRELGVHYVLEGSVRKAGQRVRITAQLIHAISGHHVWAERYDRDLEDIFAVQDEITRMIISEIAPEYRSAETRRAQVKDVKNLDSWDLIMRAHWHLTKFEKADNLEAQRLLAKAVALDPGSALAHSSLAYSHVYSVLFGWAEVGTDAIALAADAARKAVAIDDRDAWAQATLARVELLRSRHDESIARLNHAIALNPNDPYVYGQLGLTLGLGGEPERAVGLVKEAIRLSPRDPLMAVWYGTLAITEFYAGNYQAAVDWSEKATRENAQHAASYRILAASLSALDRTDEAVAVLTRLYDLQPGLTIAALRQQAPPTRDPAAKEDYLDALRRVGLPEG